MSDIVVTEKAKPYAVVVVGSEADDAGHGSGLLGTYLTDGIAEAVAERANADAETLGIVARYRWLRVAS